MNERDQRDAKYTCEIGPDEPCSVAVVRAVAAVDGRTPLELPELLQTVVDPDALDQLFAGPCEALGPEMTLSFVYCGYLVTVHADRTVQVDERSGA